MQTSSKTAHRIFIVEDEAMIAMELNDRLAAVGYSPCGMAARGDVALERIRESQPSLVLMDINLSGKMNGIAVAQQVREEMNIPVLFLTAYSDDELVAQATETGSHGYLVKPFNERELRANIEFALYKHAAETQLREANRLLEQSKTELMALTFQLSETLAQVKELHGIIPICLYCKKIKSEAEYWEAVETYISKHTNAVFSHGFCPECVEIYKAASGFNSREPEKS